MSAQRGEVGPVYRCARVHGPVMRHPVLALARRFPTAVSVGAGRVCVLIARRYKSFFSAKPRRERIHAPR
jgi:hypothetical protein